MKQGEALYVPVSIPLSLKDVEEIIFSIKAEPYVHLPLLWQKSYPKEVSFEKELFLLPFSGEESAALPQGYLALEAQIRYHGGQIAKSETARFGLEEAVYCEEER